MRAATSFLRAILGPAGADALAPLVKAEPELDFYLPARAALAWVAATSDYSGVIPGTDIPMALTKHAETWTAAFGTSDASYAMIHAGAASIAAAITVYLDAVPGRPDLRDVDLARLGKTIDALVKAQRRKTSGGGSGESESGTGVHAKPIGPEPPAQPTPVAPEAPAAQGAKKAKPKLPKLPNQKPTALKLSVSESLRPCPVCHGRSFDGVKFVGCYCFKSLAKSVSVKVMSDGAGFELGFGPDWDRDAIVTLSEIVKR